MNEQILTISILGSQKKRDVRTLPFNDQTIKGIVNEIPLLKEGYDFVLNGKAIVREDWSTTFLSPSDKIVFIPDFGFSVIIAAIAGISAAISAGLAAGGMVGFFTKMALSMGIGLLIQALSPKPKGIDVTDTPAQNQAYGWDPKTTQQQGLIKPRIYGKFKNFGNIVSSYASIKEDDDEKLIMNALINHGTGPVKSISDIRINKQPTSNFPDISTETRRGLLEQTPISFFNKLRIQYRPNIVVTHDGDAVTWEVPDKDYDDLEIILKLRNLKYLAGGGTGDNTIGVKVEIKELPDGAFETIYEDNLVHSGVNVYRKSIVLSDCEYEIENGKKYTIKITKTTADSEKTDIIDDLGLEYITEISDDALEYPGLVLVGITGLLTDEFSGLSEASCIVEGQICHVYDPTSGVEAWVLDWTDNPAYVIANILTQPIISGSGTGEDPYAIEGYDGIGIDRVNWDSIYELAVHCNSLVPDGNEENDDLEKLQTFNGVFDTETNVWEAVVKVCSISRCAPVWEGNVVEFIIDEAVERSDILTAGNIIDGSFTEEFLPLIDRVADIEVPYNDVNDGYERTIVTIFSTSLDTHSNKATLDFPGIVKESEAWRLAKFHLAHNEYLIRTIQVKADIDALGYKIGDRIGIQHDTPNWNSLNDFGCRGSGRVLKVVLDEAGDKVTIDYDEISNGFESGETYELLVRLKNNTLVLKTIVSASGNEITIDGQYDEGSIPDVDDIWAIGKENLTVKDFRLIKKSQTEDQIFLLDLIEYDERIYRYDNFNPEIVGIGTTPSKSDKHVLSPPTLSDIKKQSPAGVSSFTPDLGLVTIANISWDDDVPSGSGIEWSAVDSDYPIVLTYKGINYIIPEGDTEESYIYWDKNADAGLSFQTTNVLSTAISSGRWLMAINEDGIATEAFVRKIIHGGLIQADTITTNKLVAKIITADKIYDEAGLVTGVKADTQAWEMNGTTEWTHVFHSSYDGNITYNIKQFYCEAGQIWQARIRTKWLQTYYPGNYGAIRPELWVGSSMKYAGTNQSSQGDWTIFQWGPITLSEHGINIGNTVQVKLRLTIDERSAGDIRINLYSEGSPGDKITTHSPYGTILKE